MFVEGNGRNPVQPPEVSLWESFENQRSERSKERRVEPERSI